MTRYQPSERGSASVLVAGAIGMLVMAAVVLTWVIGFLAATARAGSAADLAALAAARGLLDGDPCAQARRVAAINSSDLTTCEIRSDSSVVVQVAVRVRGPIGQVAHAARAGLAP